MFKYNLSGCASTIYLHHIMVEAIYTNYYLVEAAVDIIFKHP